MAAKLKKVGILKTVYVDSLTGEPLDSYENAIEYLADSREQFWLMYSSMVIILKGSSDSRMNLFASLLDRYSKGQEFSFTGHLKGEISKETKCSARTLERSFASLVKDNIIVKIGSRAYSVNPRHVFQGSMKERNNMLTAILKLNCNA